jgi:hypothetical protein
MKSKIFETIEFIYKDKNYSFFRKRCKKKIEHVIQLIKKEVSLVDIEMTVEEDSYTPAYNLYIKYTSFASGGFKVFYSTEISVSKIIPLFHILHCFEVENIDLNKLAPVLDGFGNQAYCTVQKELEEIVRKILIKNNFDELSLSEMNEVVLGVRMPSDIAIFGSQMTIENCLFRDLYGICNEPFQTEKSQE